jgi:hypothetical protein
MNWPGHRIEASLGEAALKTHALQKLRDRRASPTRAKRLECGSVRLAEPVRFIGAFRRARDGQRFMGPMHCRKTEDLSMNRKMPCLEMNKLRILGFMVPMHAQKRKEPLHEP